MEKEIIRLFEKIKETVAKTDFSVEISQEGKVLSVGDGIVKVSGLRDAKLYELVELESGDKGVVFDLNAESLGIVLLTEQNGIKAGDGAYKTEQIVSVPAGEALLGRVLDALGNPLDGGPKSEHSAYYPVEREAPSLLQRDFITQPLYTGIKLIDAMLPIGRGQRELIIGDPSIGKTDVAIDTIINQKSSDVISIYVAYRTEYIAHP